MYVCVYMDSMIIHFKYFEPWKFIVVGEETNDSKK